MDTNEELEGKIKRLTHQLNKYGYLLTHFEDCTDIRDKGTSSLLEYYMLEIARDIVSLEKRVKANRAGIRLIYSRPLSLGENSGR